MLLIVAVVVGALLASGVGDGISRSTSNAVCRMASYDNCEPGRNGAPGERKTRAPSMPSVGGRVSGGPSSNGAGAPAGMGDSPAAVRSATEETASGLGAGTLVASYADGGMPSGGEARAAFLGVLKKLGRRAAGARKICQWTIGRLEKELVGACMRSVGACRGLVGRVCGVSKKLCSVARNVACFGLDLLCGVGERVPPRPGLARLFVQRRQLTLHRLDAESQVVTSGVRRGMLRESRDLRTSNPPDDARRVFDELVRGPGVRRVNRAGEPLRAVTPEGRQVLLRSPAQSGTGHWTVEVHGGTRFVKYKFSP